MKAKTLKRRHGGKAEHEDGKPSGRVRMHAAGNPDVFKEAEGEEPYSKKRGGRAKHKKRDGGAVAHKMTGGAVRPRLDRPGRKRGGRVGSDMTPLTQAHNVHSGEVAPDENGGD